MSRVVLLDTGPLGQVTHPKRDSVITDWLQSLRSESTELRVPEVADYELRQPSFLYCDAEKACFKSGNFWLKVLCRY